MRRTSAWFAPAIAGVLAAMAATVAARAQQPSTGAGAPPPECREVMVPVRDGVRLETTIVSPANAAGSLPIIVQRTPYGVPSCPLNAGLPGTLRQLAADGYHFVFQNIRGRGRSEGRFVMNRPLRPAGDTTSTDEATDTWDLIEWLLSNVPHNNGRVGVMGVSYPGWLAEVPLAYPHPALKAVSPQAPMTDTWMGDDFFHQGAFRMSFGYEYGVGMEARMVGLEPPRPDRYDAYDYYRRFPTLRALWEATRADRVPTWQNFINHPAYDSVWQSRAFQRGVTRVAVPTLTVGGWWDQEDLFGPLATYAALERFDTAGVNHLVMGPWNHGGWARSRGDSLGNLVFGQATSDSFRLNVQAPWFRYWLHGRGDGRFPEALVYDAGADRWRSFNAWPPREAVRRRLYLREDGRLSFDPPATAAGFDQYLSDPDAPVPYRPRPVTAAGWGRWMTEDQRFVHGRPDVLSWESEPLAEDVTVAGDVVAHLFASTTGSDADWVVKLIDVMPDDVPDRPVMRGYQLMVAGDVMRGRYRRSFERAEPIPSNRVLEYVVDLHQQAYTFRRGHRMMVQVQSTWFPLYDRNPQTFVPNIFLAPASAYRAQTHRIFRTPRQPSHIELMVIG